MEETIIEVFETRNEEVKKCLEWNIREGRLRAEYNKWVRAERHKKVEIADVMPLEMRLNMIEKDNDTEGWKCLECAREGKCHKGKYKKERI